MNTHINKKRLLKEKIKEQKNFHNHTNSTHGVKYEEITRKTLNGVEYIHYIPIVTKY